MIKQPENVIQEIQTALEKSVGHKLTALYLYGSVVQDKYAPGLSDINLLAVVEEGTNIHEIQTTLWPIWQKHSQAIRQLPLIATPATLNRHLQLNPTLADHLSQFGRLLIGKQLIGNVPPPSDADHISRIVRAALAASEALAPQLLPEDQAKPAAEKLFRLANQLTSDSHFNSPVAAFAAVQAHLAQLIADCPEFHWTAPPPKGAPPLINALLAIYEMREQAIFLLPDWPPNKIRDYIAKVDWTAVAQSLQGQYKGLQISTPAQYRLHICHNQSDDHYFQNYNLAWGQDPLASLNVPHWRVVQGLANFASQIELETLPHDYISADDKQRDKLIHDFQNKLLNIQLREELMSRFDRRKRLMPPDSLPDRTAAPQTRIDAIFNHFNWWANHYTAVMHDERSQSN